MKPALALAQNLYVALVHHPVVNRNGELITSSVTNLDLHDIARASRTYGVKGYFVVHPSQDQQALNRRIIQHWSGAFGYHANPTRREALDLIHLVPNLEEALLVIQIESKARAFLVGTSAKPRSNTAISIPRLREKLEEGPCLLVFGTAYGLAPEWDRRLEAHLPPIVGPADYNHLSVRSATSIYLDRLFGI